jgi:hypothetical protein
MTRSLCVLALAAGLLPVRTVAAAETVTRTLAVTARFESRTSLTISSELLRFDVLGPDQPASTVVEFSAAARTGSGGEVVLSVEPVSALTGPGDAPVANSLVSFSGEGQGTLRGVVSSIAPTIAGRWTGSGVRGGRLVFLLQAAVPGSYTLPVRFVLTAP